MMYNVTPVMHNVCILTSIANTRSLSVGIMWVFSLSKVTLKSAFQPKQILFLFRNLIASNWKIGNGSIHPARNACVSANFAYLKHLLRIRTRLKIYDWWTKRKYYVKWGIEAIFNLSRDHFLPLFLAFFLLGRRGGGRRALMGTQGSSATSW